MAIIYSYPIATPELQDLLVGTEMAIQGGEDTPRTRTFTIGSIIDLVEATLPPQVNSDWNATSGFAEILNKPVIPTTPGLQQVLDVDTYAEVDGGNSYADILGGNINNRWHDFTISNGLSGIDYQITSIVSDSDNASLISVNGNETARIKATGGNVELHRQANEIGKKTVVTFNRPTQDTTLDFPAKSVAGTYTLATLDDMPAAPALVFLDEGNGNGIARPDRDPALFGNIGEYAFDISWSDGTNYGATGESSFAVGDNLTAQGYASFLIGQGNVSSDEGNYTFQSGYNHNETGSCFANFFTGSGHSVTGGAYATIVGQFANVITNNPNNVNDGNNTMFAIGNGTATGEGTLASRSTALQVYRDGRIVAPTLTTALITADTTGKIVATKEYVNSTRPYKVYTALLSQNGINPPVATVLENTLGYTLNFSRVGVGVYALNTPSYNRIFTINKTQVYFGQHTYSAAILLTANPNAYNDIVEFHSIICSTDTFTDNGLSNSSIEIRVYN